MQNAADYHLGSVTPSATDGAWLFLFGTSCHLKIIISWLNDKRWRETQAENHIRCKTLDRFISGISRCLSMIESQYRESLIGQVKLRDGRLVKLKISRIAISSFSPWLIRKNPSWLFGGIWFVIKLYHWKCQMSNLIYLFCWQNAAPNTYIENSKWVLIIACQWVFDVGFSTWMQW